MVSRLLNGPQTARATIRRILGGSTQSGGVPQTPLPVRASDYEHVIVIDSPHPWTARLPRAELLREVGTNAYYIQSIGTAHKWLGALLGAVLFYGGLAGVALLYRYEPLVAAILALPGASIGLTLGWVLFPRVFNPYGGSLMPSGKVAFLKRPGVWVVRRYTDDGQVFVDPVVVGSLTEDYGQALDSVASSNGAHPTDPALVQKGIAYRASSAYDMWRQRDWRNVHKAEQVKMQRLAFGLMVALVICCTITLAIFTIALTKPY